MRDAAAWGPLEAAKLVQRFNEHFGQGTITLDYVVNEMPNDAYEAWWSYFLEYAQRSALRKEQDEHDDMMGKVKKALTH